VKQAEELRQEILSRFPLANWPNMPLERYALGQADQDETYSQWLEFKSVPLGSMKGGSSSKHIIYKHKDEPGWYFPSGFANEREAWVALRADVSKMFEFAEQGRWLEIQDLMPFQYGPALWLKSLHVYFPNEILGIYSTAHLAHFRYVLSRVHHKTSKKLGPVLLNRTLLTELRQRPEIDGFGTLELGMFLYHWSDPRIAKPIYKIAPGENANLWNECLSGGYIAVGWPKVGSLDAFENYESFYERFQRDYAESYGDSPAGKATLTRKSKEVWTLQQIEPGDLIIANRGTSHILAVGEVLEPTYEWAGENNEHPHRIRVKWDTSKARDIEAEKRWAFNTVAPVSIEHFQRMFTEGTTLPNPNTEQISVTDPVLERLSERLEERKQLILYGPPGTGKTFTARRFLLFWLLSHEGKNAGEVLADSERSRSEWARFTSAPAGHASAQVTMVTFHPSYGYEDFVEGYRPVKANVGGLHLDMVDGLFKRVCKEALTSPQKRFVVFIDEINRGNLPRIFGELITILEADKRNIAVVLPQSQERFAVPDNVFIVGTMNTADRSIKVLDAAIRRRFAFHELMPDSSLLSGQKIGDLALDDLLDYLNNAIAIKVGRERQLGHSFLLEDDEPIADVDEFAKRLRYEIIPLLQEYCYEDYGLLADFLGEQLVDRN
jgi:5-methylcytosine-specific restriction protein B